MEWRDFTEDDLYWSRCEIQRVLDGDSLLVTFLLAFNQSLRNERCRMAYIDAPETWRKSEPGGAEATEWLRDVLARNGNRVVCRTLKSSDKFGRWLIELFVPEFECSVNMEMVRLGLAKKYVV